MFRDLRSDPFIVPPTQALQPIELTPLSRYFDLREAFTEPHYILSSAFFLKGFLDLPNLSFLGGHTHDADTNSDSNATVCTFSCNVCKSNKRKCTTTIRCAVSPNVVSWLKYLVENTIPTLLHVILFTSSS